MLDLKRSVRYQSGQMDQTVNLAAQAFDGSNPSLTTSFPVVSFRENCPEALLFNSRREGRINTSRSHHELL